MKRLVTTRSSARYKPIRAVKNGFQGVIQELDSLTLASENLQTRGDAQVILISFWKLLVHVTFVLLGRNSGGNKSHP